MLASRSNTTSSSDNTLAMSGMSIGSRLEGSRSDALEQFLPSTVNREPGTLNQANFFDQP